MTYPSHWHDVVIVVQISNSDHPDSRIIPQEHHQGGNTVLYPCLYDELLDGRH